MTVSQEWNNARYQNLKIRKGCEPKIIELDNNTKNSIVLVHGLTDSPYFMEAIGLKFYEMGFNVYIPLLPGHGLQDPQGMKDVTLEKWEEEINFAVNYASQRGTTVSIGGLSTGGTLSVWKALNSPDEITGGVFLFSAALGLAGLGGNFLERLLSTRLIRRIVANKQDERARTLVGINSDDNPYRYARMDVDGAAQLSLLITKVQNLKLGTDRIIQPLFIAHSEYDSTADIEDVENLRRNHPNINKTEFFRIGKNFNVPHASVVLAEDVKSKNGSPLEPKNPFFDEMMQCVYNFARQHIEFE